MNNHQTVTGLATSLTLLALFLGAACSSEPSASDDAAPRLDRGTDAVHRDAEAGPAPDSGKPGDADVADAPDAASCDAKAQACAAQFGSLFSKSNGRADGTLVAVVRPADTQCALVNSTHVVLQRSILGQVQRLVVAVKDVAVTSVSKPLVGPAYAQGWHTNTPLDYPTDLGVHSTAFKLVSLDEAISFICAPLSIGAPVSVYAYSDVSSPSSAHQIHRNDNYLRAIVMNPTAATPTYLLFRYATQVF